MSRTPTVSVYVSLSKTSHLVNNRSMAAGICHLPESPGDFPTLETFYLKDVQFTTAK
ncbi:hypothetical protein Tco_0950149, partial [Tanacetum coccineum]